MPLPVLLLALTLASAAQERVWKQGMWATPTAETAERLVAIETSTEMVTARPADSDASSTWIGTPGDPLRYILSGSTLYLIDSQDREHTLQVVESASKYSNDYGALGGGHYIKSVASGGRSITLEDGTRWDIDPRQQFAVAGWSADDLIAVRRSTDDAAFAFELDNTSRDDGALANRRVR